MRRRRLDEAMSPDRLWDLATRRKDDFEGVQYDIQDAIEDIEGRHPSDREDLDELNALFDTITQYIDDLQDIIYMTEEDDISQMRDALKIWKTIPKRFRW